MSVLCVAGEASGDACLAPIVARLDAPFGVGGDASAQAGLEVIGSARDLAAHGLTEALATLPEWRRTWLRVCRRLPDARAALLVDFPEMNTRLLRRARAHGVPVAYLAPPQAWAWRPWRAQALRDASWVGCLLPFAADWYAARGVPAEWVGHPCAERVPPPHAPRAALALLPGSRDPSVRRLLPIMLAAVARLRCPAHLAVAPTIDRAFLERATTACGLDVRLHDDAADALAASTVALAGAGTATLEATLAGRPTVTLVRLSGTTAGLLRRVVRTPHVALPNLVLGRRAFPELVQEACTAETVAAAAGALLGAPPTEAIDELRARMDRPGYADRVTARVVALAAGRSP